MRGKHANSLRSPNTPEEVRAGSGVAVDQAGVIERIDPPETFLREDARPNRVTAERAQASEVDTALDMLTDVVVLLDAQLHIVACNAAVADLVGHSKAELSGRSLTNWFVEPLEDHLREALDRLKRGETSQVRFAATLRRHEGNPVLADVCLQRFGPTAAGLVLAVIKPSRDRGDEVAARAADEIDFLTGLPARSSLEAELKRVERSLAFGSGQLAVLFIDLDQFKHVNDSHGHRAGDLVLQNVAQRLAASVRPGDFVARYGGDEFVAVIQQLRDEKEVAGIAERIRSELSLPIYLTGGEIIVTASIGVAFSDGSAAAADLLDEADRDMYRVKRSSLPRKPR